MGINILGGFLKGYNDDQMLAKVYWLIDWCAINVGKAKDK